MIFSSQASQRERKHLEAMTSVQLHRVVRANRERVYRAFLDAYAMVKWLPPNGFTGKVHELDARFGRREPNSSRPRFRLDDTE